MTPLGDCERPWQPFARADVFREILFFHGEDVTEVRLSPRPGTQCGPSLGLELVGSRCPTIGPGRGFCPPRAHQPSPPKSLQNQPLPVVTPALSFRCPKARGSWAGRHRTPPALMRREMYQVPSLPRRMALSSPCAERGWGHLEPLVLWAVKSHR